MERYVIPNLRNACRVLSYLGEHTGGASLQVISQELAIPRTTAFRILKTLQLESIVREENRRFLLGSKLIPLGNAAAAGLEIRKVAAPLLRALTEETGETCHLAMPSECRSLILEVSLSPHPLRVTSRPGTIVDLHCSATGKLFMAHLYRERLPELVASGQFVRRTPHTLVTLEQLEAEVERILVRGYSTDDEEYHEGVRCLAVPVFDATQTVVAAVGITASRQRFRKAKTEAFYEATGRMVDALSRALGTPVVARP